MKWAVIDGEFDVSGKGLKFIGKPTPSTMPQGEERVGYALGRAICNERFSEGDITAQIEFSRISEMNACEIIFFFQPEQRTHISAGIGGPNVAFIIRGWTGEWITYAQAGDRRNLKGKQKYDVRVSVRGSRVKLFVDEVEVTVATLPFSVPASQVGILCIDDHPIQISNFKVAGQRGRVFVVMQFNSKFKTIYEEVVRRVCDDLDLEAKKADETYGPGLIIADIVNDIKESEFIIVDITHPNPNVYYELGYAHAIGKPAILLAERSLEKLPFDVSPFRVLFYEDSMVGKRAFEDGLRNHIEALLDTDVGGPKGRLTAG